MENSLKKLHKMVHDELVIQDEVRLGLLSTAAIAGRLTTRKGGVAISVVT